MTKVDLTSVEKATGSIDGGLSSIDAKAIFGKFGKEVSGDKRFEGENVSTFANEAFPVGGKSQFLSVVMGDKPWYMKRVKLQMLDTDPSKEVKEAKTVSGLNKDEVKAVAKSAEAIGDAIINAGKAYKKSKEDIDKMFAAGDKLSKEIGKAPEDVQALEAVKNLKTVLNAYSTLGSVLATCQSQLVNEAKQIGFAALTFCSKSLKGGKAAEASKEGAAA
jgi:hypothetical protein